MTSASCTHCHGPLPLPRRADMRYCSGSCRVLAARRRKAATAARVRSEQAAHIPAELRAKHRWVRHLNKRPTRCDLPRWASVRDPSTWSDHAAAAASTVGEGIGYVLTAGDGIVVVDLDHAVVDGELLPWARRIVDGLPPTYMERGRSGTGVHLWFRGSVSCGRRIRRGDVAVEWYSDGRYIVIGDRVPGTPLDLAELPDAAAAIASLV
ncbi:bifunctional DNA primase/polymerase [Embleya sp. NPDC059237]|uniref:bifunctional DNA primase/polymerase n=1 Tax=Embleya sp. NPDC059237 TaxID=3346784 RepID=UPI003699FD21